MAAVPHLKNSLHSCDLKYSSTELFYLTVDASSQSCCEPKTIYLVFAVGLVIMAYLTSTLGSSTKELLSVCI